MELKVLYIESHEDGRKVFREWAKDQYDVTIVEDLIDLDELLYNRKGYDKYDALVIDLALSKAHGITIEDYCDEIPEFQDINFTNASGSITLLGFDYFKYVVLTRPETDSMVKDKRVVLLSGHAKIVRRDNIFTDSEFPHTELIDRADRQSMDKLAEIFEQIRQGKNIKRGD